MATQAPDSCVNKEPELMSSPLPSRDLLNTQDPQWTLEDHLVAYVQRSSESAISPVKTARRDSNNTILQGFNGIVKNGEMLLVLGRPGSGCTTLLKTLAGMTEDYTGWSGLIEFSGVPIETVRKRFRGAVTYNPEVDVHFPHLSVAQTLEFAAQTRAPHSRIVGYSRSDYVQNIRNVLATTFGLQHALDTKVGDDFVRGVSGGERKRVSISEMLAVRAPIGIWDNTTRGLDASTSLEFVQAMRTTTNVLRNITVAALYQASENMTDIFDKVTVLYAGRQVFFGTVHDAREHFQDMGFVQPPRQTTADYLTSVTDPNTRIIKDGFEKTAPRNAEQFAKRWQESIYYSRMQTQMAEHKKIFPTNNITTLKAFEDVLEMDKTPWSRKGSPYLINVGMQMTALMKRAYQRTLGDKAVLFAGAFAALFMSLILGSAWYNTKSSTDGFFSSGGVVFFALLFTTLQAMSEIPLLYTQRPVVTRQNAYAMYHPAIESLANMTADYPIKLINVVVLDVTMYFLTNLKREPGAFFVFLLFTYTSFVVMSSFFRTVGAATRTIESALSIAGVFLLALVVYSGYIIPIPTMHPWFKWISYINPLRYAFESLMANEFHSRLAICDNLIPTGEGFNFSNQVCAITGSTPGSPFVSGDQYIEASFTYSYSHVWRNFGILVGFWVFFSFTYALATELQKPAGSKGEFLIFRKGYAPDSVEHVLGIGKYNKDLEKSNGDMQHNVTEEFENSREIATAQSNLPGFVKSKDVFTWQNVCYDLTVKGGVQRKLLDNVHGYVKPGTLTALMGESGAGKTTLLNVLAQRIDTGIITGDMLVNGSALDVSFQRKSGYVQQQDVHLAEATVREALRFSALLRQPKDISIEDKYNYVERVINMLEMEEYAEAVIGHPGSGLSVEQRKRTSIGVELVAKPALLLFLDEPTSGLDSQSSQSVIDFLRKLANAGQAILCTIHQPSSILFEQFDRVLLLQKGGQTVYFGDIGENSRTIIDYFEHNGASKCADTANPAEYILEVIGAGAAARVHEDWHQIWTNSKNCRDVAQEIRSLQNDYRGSEQHHTQLAHQANSGPQNSKAAAFALPWFSQYKAVQIRIFQQYWRSPIYIFGKLILNVFAGLFLGFTFYKEDSSVAGLQNKLFAVFIAVLLSFPLMNQLQPAYISLRNVYEVREKPSKMYHWSTFVLSNLIVEFVWNIVGTTLFFFPWYYAVGFDHHVEDSSARGGYTWLLMVFFAMYYTTFGQIMAAIAPDVTSAGILTTLISTFIIIFNGTLQPLSQLPHFWKFMYHLSPYTYIIGGLLSNAVHGIATVCKPSEVNIFQPPQEMSCEAYAGEFVATAAGKLLNPNATSECQYCRYAVADQWLASLDLSWDQRWRNLGFTCAYVLFNVVILFVLFFVLRVWKMKRRGG
ncbi:Brefeldin A resistance protein [Trichoderma velutinum]